MDARQRRSGLIHTIKYPPNHPLTTIPIATETLADPKTLPTTVGIVEKKPPFAMPLMITNRMRGPMEFDNGQMTNRLTALSNKLRNNVFNEPSLSHAKPHERRPTVELKLKAATRAAPTLAERPIELEYSGKKNGGTKSGKVPIKPVRKTSTKRMSLKRDLRQSKSTFFQTQSNQSGEYLPLDHQGRRNGHSLLDQICCRQTSSQSHQSHDPEGPSNAHLFE